MATPGLPYGEWIQRVELALPLIIQAWFDAYEFSREVVTDTIDISSGTDHMGLVSAVMHPTQALKRASLQQTVMGDYGYSIRPSFKEQDLTDEHKAQLSYGKGACRPLIYRFNIYVLIVRCGSRWSMYIGIQ